MLGEPHTLAFVSGNGEEQENQKTEIREYCKNSSITLLSDSGFFSDWDMLLMKLKDKGIVIITDIRVLSGDYKEIAIKLFVLMMEHHNFVYTVEEKQLNELEKCQYDKYPEAWPKVRKLAGIEKACQDILEGDDKSLCKQCEK